MASTAYHAPRGWPARGRIEDERAASRNRPRVDALAMSPEYVFRTIPDRDFYYPGYRLSPAHDDYRKPDRMV
jgi:hypothetical protein